MIRFIGKIIVLYYFSLLGVRVQLQGLPLQDPPFHIGPSELTQLISPFVLATVI